jgi:hypothetical protein
VVILGIASAIVAPQLGSRSDIKIRAAARLLVADLMYAQNNAIAQQKWIYVRFDAAGEKYSVMDGAGANATDTSRIIKHPVTKAEFTTKLGVATDRRLGDVKIKTVTFNGVDTNYRPEFVIAFDELGVPYVYCYDLNNTNELLDGTVELECGARTRSRSSSSGTRERSKSSNARFHGARVRRLRAPSERPAVGLGGHDPVHAVTCSADRPRHRL